MIIKKKVSDIWAYYTVNLMKCLIKGRLYIIALPFVMLLLMLERMFPYLSIKTRCKCYVPSKINPYSLTLTVFLLALSHSPLAHYQPYPFQDNFMSSAMCSPTQHLAASRREQVRVWWANVWRGLPGRRSGESHIMRWSAEDGTRSTTGSAA